MKISVRHGEFTENLRNGAVALWTAIAIVLLSPDLALAQAPPADTAGTIICNVQAQLGHGGTSSSLVTLFTGIAYILGSFSMARGLYQFKEYADSPGRPPLHHPILKCIGGVCLMALPAMIGWIFSTLYIQPGGGGLGACAPGAATVSTDPSVWFTNFVDNIKNPMTWLVSILGYVLGALLMIRGFVKLTKFGTDPRAYSLPAILANLIVGAIIFSMGSASAFMMNTIFGTGTAMTAASAGVTSWKIVTGFGAGSAQFANVITAAIHFFQLIGAISFLRGWLIIKGAAEGGQGTMAQGFTHIIGGIMAMNLFYMLKAFDTTLGTNLL